ncbi:MAG: AAA family ATPase [Verrucomicrobia bacterium]|jgi:DNA-binding CsgD family transcriptional regulator|nr:AAA family ATPase [Verrucomicrobiota bacterium]
MSDRSKHFVGRERERNLLRSLFDETSQDKGAICFVSGEGGSGKTCFVEGLLDELDSTFSVFQTHSLPEDTTPFGLLGSILKLCPGGQRFSTVKRILKLLYSKTRTVADEEFDPKNLGRIIVDAVCEVTGDSPSILFLDDIQWADPSSLEVLPLLASETSTKPMVIVATCNEDELTRHHPARRLRARLNRFSNATEISLGPLSSAETMSLTERIIGMKPDRKLAEEIYQRTSGLPLFVEELYRSLSVHSSLQRQDHRSTASFDRSLPTPDSLRDAISLQCQVLSPAGLRSLEMASILGKEFPLDHLEKLGAGGAEIDELLERQFLLSRSGGSVSFRHAMTREAVLEEISHSRRRELHGLAGDLLKGKHDHLHSRAIAEHYREGGRPEDARTAFIDVATQACHIHAYRDASWAFEEALKLWPIEHSEEDRLDCIERLAHCALACGFVKESVKSWSDLVTSKLIQKDPTRLALAWSQLASSLELSGSKEKAIEAREKALTGFNKAGKKAEAGYEALALADSLICKCQFVAGKTKAEYALRAGRTVDDKNLESKSLSTIGLALAMQGKQSAARRRVEAGLELAINHNLKEGIACAYTQLAYVHGYQGDYTGQHSSFGTAIDFCKREGLQTSENACLGCMAYAAFRLGDWKQSTKLARQVQAKDESNLFASAGLGLVYTMRGQVKQARRSLESVALGAQEKGITPIELVVAPALAQLDHYTNAHTAAISRFRGLLKQWESTEDCFDSLFGLCLAATFFGEHELRDELSSTASSIQRIVSQNRNPESMGSLAHVSGEIALLEGHFSDAATNFLQSRTHFQKINVRYDIARSEYRTGIALLQGKSFDSGIEYLKRAHAGASKLGAQPLKDAIRLKLEEATGEKIEPSKTGNLSGRKGLTRRQFDVAKLISKGLTNKEIAQDLRLSTRTVDMHVSHLLDRLDSTTRSQAVRRLFDLGLLD